MKNRNIGLLLIGIIILIGLLTWSYENALNNIVATSCNNGTTCPMYHVLGTQRMFSTILILIIVGVATYFIFIDYIKKFKWLENAKVAVSGEERLIYEELRKNDNKLSQSELIANLNITKVKMTRLLNRLEKKGLIDRKRSGVGNIVELKVKLVSQ